MHSVGHAWIAGCRGSSIHCICPLQYSLQGGRGEGGGGCSYIVLLTEEGLLVLWDGGGCFLRCGRGEVGV